ncbi:CheR family methyltransferase [Christensenella intestinihominis]|uniref:CheR family methyltransferase n=1 Tax=Christensenella intestinihominis TaxID=1851429 RepID=UPI00083366F5|nr:protein-glutamate O-methyltransferase CheR [Christensenella intestinihominis]
MKLNTHEFYKLRDFMYQRFGINLSQKQQLIEGRLGNVLEKRGFKSFSDFISHMEADHTGEDVSLVVAKLTTNFTYFYREEQHFEFLRNVALPELVPRISDGNLSIWSAGCSSGEEPYTIAMFLNDYFGGDKHGLDTRILATDISDKVLGIAGSGVYRGEHMTKMPKEWYRKYFSRIQGDEYEVVPQIKKEVIYRKFNLMEPEFRFKKKFHIVFCRNVMIYFDEPTRRKLARKFYDAILPGGYLFIGLSETLIRSEAGFEYVQPSIYRKKGRGNY